MKLRRMIGDVLAVRLKDPDNDRVILEIKTNGKCVSMTPNIERAHEVLCTNFNVPLSKRKEVFESIGDGQFNSEFLYDLVRQQLRYKD